MKIIQLILIIVLFFTTFLSTGQGSSPPPEKFHFENDFSVISNSISGPGKANSSLTEGTNYLNLFSSYGRGQIGDFSYSFNMNGKITDDPNFDMEKYTLTGLSFKAASEDHAFVVGDTYEFFTPFTMSTAIKGASYNYRGDISPWVPNITMVYGKAAPRWDNLWGGFETDIVNRDVCATRIGYRVGKNMRAGINIIDSRDSDPVRSSDILYDNRVYSVDFEFSPIERINLAGETAFNNTNITSSDNRVDDELNDQAVAFKISGNSPFVQMAMEYERVDPDFRNPLGTMTPDREKVKFSGRYKLHENIHMYTNFLWFQDNLDGQKPWGQTDVYIPELTFGYSQPFSRSDAFLKISYMREFAFRDSEQFKTYDMIRMNFRDRFGIIDTDTNLGVNFREHNGSYESENKELTFNTNLRSMFSTGRLQFKPSMFLGGWTIRDELSLDRDHAYQYSLGLGIDLPMHGITTNMTMGVNRVEKEQGVDSTKTFGKFYIDWKPDILSKLNEMILYFSGAFNDFDFSRASENFREEKILAGIKIKY